MTSGVSFLPHGEVFWPGRKRFCRIAGVKMVLSHPIIILFNPSASHPLQNPCETFIFTQHKRETPVVLFVYPEFSVNLFITYKP